MVPISRATLDAALFTVTDLSTATLDSVASAVRRVLPTALPATWFCQNGTLWGQIGCRGVDFNGLCVLWVIPENSCISKVQPAEIRSDPESLRFEILGDNMIACGHQFSYPGGLHHHGVR